MTVMCPSKQRSQPCLSFTRLRTSTHFLHNNYLTTSCCRFDSVIHFAGRKAVGESVEHPMLYYTHNVVGAVNLIEAMRKHDVKNVRIAFHPHTCLVDNHTITLDYTLTSQKAQSHLMPVNDW